jgi:hypothetical protein
VLSHSLSSLSPDGSPVINKENSVGVIKWEKLVERKKVGNRKIDINDGQIVVYLYSW